MKTTTQVKRGQPLVWLILSLANFFLAQSTIAQIVPKFGPPLLDSWSFNDSSNWTDDDGDYPISFTNITSSVLGDGTALVMETNVPAWLNYEIYQTNVNWTNFIADGPGSVAFWFGPGWSTTNGGPGDWAQLIDIGQWTSNSSIGYFGLSISPSGSNILFLVQDGAGDNYSLSAPISWTTNYFNFIALTYSATNVSLYLNGQLATNDPGGLSLWPPENVISNGLFFGSDQNGNYLANGLFNTIQAYGFPLDSNTVDELYDEQVIYYELSPFNAPYMGALSSAGSNPSTNSTSPDVITGSGDLQWDGTNSNCSYSTNGLWITNFVAIVVSNGTMNVTFSINGGTNGALYDVFAISTAQNPMVSGTWSWMGQGLSCNTYTIMNISNAVAFFILGTPQDTAGAELTDAYQLLVSKTNPNVQVSDLDGLITGWEILLGLNPHISNLGNSAQRVNYTYTPADWLTNVSGIKGISSLGMDNEGNVTQVSQ